MWRKWRKVGGGRKKEGEMGGERKKRMRGRMGGKKAEKSDLHVRKKQKLGERRVEKRRSRRGG